VAKDGMSARSYICVSDEQTTTSIYFIQVKRSFKRLLTDQPVATTMLGDSQWHNPVLLRALSRMKNAHANKMNRMEKGRALR
jgi:hypothetical protein